jgi:hypothetical protein
MQAVGNEIGKGSAMKSKLTGVAATLAFFAIAPQAAMAATFDVVADFNNTGVQPAPGNPHTYPFTYGTETALNVGFTLLPLFGNTTCSLGACQNAGTVDNYYFIENFQFAGPSVAVAAAHPLLWRRGSCEPPPEPQNRSPVIRSIAPWPPPRSRHCRRCGSVWTIAQ